MTNASNISELMKQIGPLLEIREVLESTEEPSWSLTWEDGLVVVADYAEDDHRLTLTSHVGPLAGSDVESIATLMLRYNGLWFETGGVRLGLDENHFVLIYDLFASGLDLPTLCDGLVNFAAKAQIWVQLIDNQTNTPVASSNAADAQAGLLEMLASGTRI